MHQVLSLFYPVACQRVPGTRVLNFSCYQTRIIPLPFTSSSAQFAQYRAFHRGWSEPTLCNVLNANMDACGHRSKDHADDMGWQLGARVKKNKHKRRSVRGVVATAQVCHVFHCLGGILVVYWQSTAGEHSVGG